MSVGVPPHLYLNGPDFWIGEVAGSVHGLVRDMPLQRHLRHLRFRWDGIGGTMRSVGGGFVVGQRTKQLRGKRACG